MTCYLALYLLTGFVIQFASVAANGTIPKWRWELAATLVWPLILLLMAVNLIKAEK
jgi:hypothetical protein